jgi:ribosomal protein S18 acetylase RimI-like enzyme
MEPPVLASRSLEIRKYRPADRAQVRKLCSDTGFLGKPIDPVFEDRELFADFWTGYYLQHEPGSAFVAVLNGEIKGYLLGSNCLLKHQLYNMSQKLVLALKAITRYPRLRLDSRRFLHWIVLNAWREVPAAPRRLGHFHINLLPEARSIEVCRSLLETYLRFLHDQGIRRVYGQMVTFDNRRSFRLFERYGFKVMNRSEITKYKQFTNRKVYLCTVIKELDEQNERLLYPARSGRTTAARNRE